MNIIPIHLKKTLIHDTLYQLLFPNKVSLCNASMLTARKNAIRPRLLTITRFEQERMSAKYNILYDELNHIDNTAQKAR